MHDGLSVAVRIGSWGVVHYELAHVPPRQVFAFGLNLAPPLHLAVSVFDYVQGTGTLAAFADRRS
jgi:hypothetical protein